MTKLSKKFVLNGPTNNNTSLFYIMAWRREGDNALSEPMMAYFTDTYMHHSASMSYHFETESKFATSNRRHFQIHLLKWQNFVVWFEIP